jgi:uncharacterized protein
LDDVEVVVIADTHLRAGIEALDGSLLDALQRADVILHAGDVVSRQALDDLHGLGTVFAVLGNNDTELRGVLPEETLISLEGVSVAVIHDSGASSGRAARLMRRFPTADIVVFGHSHIPMNVTGIGDQVLFNPGSPTQRRSQPHRTFGRLLLVDGHIQERTVELSA